MIDRGDNSANHNYEVVYYFDYRSRQLSWEFYRRCPGIRCLLSRCVIRGRTILIMVSKFIIYTLSVLAVCSFCGEDFISLGRHSWRCKRKLHQGASQNHATNGNSHLPQDLSS